MTNFIASLVMLLASAVAANAADKDPVLKFVFNTTCGVCSNSAKLSPLKVDGHSATTVQGGAVRGVTLTFKCDSRKCRKKFRQEAEVFVPKALKATVDGAGIPPVPDEAKAGSQQDAPFKHHWSYGNPITPSVEQFRGGWSSDLTNFTLPSR